MTICSTCKVSQPKENFSWKVRDKKRSGVCKSCHKAYRRRHYLNNRQKYIDKARAWEELQGGKIAVRYNLTAEQLSDMLSKYDSKCWVCRTRPAVVIDHDHSCCSGDKSCGQCIRGVLCSGCNTGLGRLGDNLDGLQRAVVYLEEYKSGRAVGKPK